MKIPPQPAHHHSHAHRAPFTKCLHEITVIVIFHYVVPESLNKILQPALETASSFSTRFLMTMLLLVVFQILIVSFTVAWHSQNAKIQI